MKKENASPTLRDRQVAATRAEILDVGMRMVSKGGVLSHEAIADQAHIGVRTVYRHFPDRAQLLQGLWELTREKTNIRFPAHEEDIAPLLRTAFRSFDQNEALVRAVLSSGAGMEVRDRGGIEGKAAFAHSLQEQLRGFPSSHRPRVIAVFLAIYSAPFWQLLRDRGGLGASEAQEAAAWLIDVVLDALKDEKLKDKKKKK
jgi:AcrR family transcriptional regulator